VRPSLSFAQRSAATRMGGLIGRVRAAGTPPNNALAGLQRRSPALAALATRDDANADRQHVGRLDFWHWRSLSRAVWQNSAGYPADSHKLSLPLSWCQRLASFLLPVPGRLRRGILSLGQVSPHPVQSGKISRFWP
jgi:hypothetical protein